MKHKTFQLLRDAHLGNVDKTALLEAKRQEPDAFHRTIIDLVLDPKSFHVPWDMQAYTSQFREADPRTRMDETVMAHLLRLAILVKEEAYMRTFQKPESFEANLAWVHLLRLTLQCTLALLYKVPWDTPESHAHLEDAILKMLTGDASALRNLMRQLGIQLAQEEPYPAELIFERMNLLHVVQWSGFTWRFLHWMAEADPIRGETRWRDIWRGILASSFRRTLRCHICSSHFERMAQKHREELLTGDLRTLLFRMHNEVHAERRSQWPDLREPDYTEAQFAEDVDFMLKGLSA